MTATELREEYKDYPEDIGAWLVKGKGPTRRYSTKALAEREVQRRRQPRGKGRAS